MLTQKLIAKVALAAALVMGMTAEASANPWRGPHYAPVRVVAPAPVYRASVVYQAPVYRAPVVYQAPVYQAPVYRAPVVYQTPVAYQAPVVYQTPVAYQAPVAYPTPVVYQAPVYRAPVPVYVPARPVVWHHHGFGGWHHGRRF